VTAGRARWALLGCAAALLAVHGAAGWLSPLQGDDWRQLAGSPDRSWLAAHAELAEVWGYLLARWPVVHAIATPVAGAIAIAGVFTLSMRRLPDPGRWSDVLGLALVSCVIWIALPRAGAMWFHRPYAAAQIYGAALAVWFLVPFRCGARLGGVGWPIAMFALGLAVGASTRQIGLAATIGAAIAVSRTRQPGRLRWMVPGLAGVAIRFVAGAVRWPRTDLVYVFAHPERSLVRMEPLLQAGGPLIALIALLVIARQRVGPPDRAAAADARWTAPLPDAGDSLWWLGGWLGLGVAALLGPSSTAATQLPAAIALCAGALPYLSWLAGTRFARWILIGLVSGVHLAAWVLALSHYRALDAEFRDRMAAIARTPANRIATVAPYTDILPDFWSIGEDWAEAAGRDALALERWGLAGIDLAPPFRQLERSPELHLALEVDGVSGAELAAAWPPPVWARDPANARRQFTALVARLRSAVGRDVPARLRVTDGELVAGAPRPIYAAWSDDPDDAGVVAPVVTRSVLDPTSVETIGVPPALAARLPEAWVVTPAGAHPARCQPGSCRVKIERAERVVLLLCGAARCLAADAQIPHL
jgi:hypothetical protein